MKDPIRNYTPTRLDIVKNWAANIYVQLDTYQKIPGARETTLIPTDQLFDFAEAAKENTPRGDDSLHRGLDDLRHTAMMSEREDRCCSVVIDDLSSTLSQVLQYAAH